MAKWGSGVKRNDESADFADSRSTAEPRPETLSLRAFDPTCGGVICERNAHFVIASEGPQARAK
ncbi:MAG: hypothetical protein C4532_09110, partial [Candidatus Abyssobacteria bacterium SURF_17]